MYFRTPTNPGAMTPAQMLTKAAEIIGKAAFTAAAVAAFATMFLILG